MMKHILPELQEDYERWLSKLDDEDPCAGATTIGICDVLRAHYLVVHPTSSCDFR